MPKAILLERDIIGVTKLYKSLPCGYVLLQLQSDDMV